MIDGPNESELGRDVDESMRMFAKSQVGSAAALVPARPSRVLLALDGSPQDETSIAAAITMRERFNIETVVLDARDRPSTNVEDSPSSDTPVPDAAAESAPTTSAPASSTDDLAPIAAGRISGARPIARTETASYDAILAAVATHAVDLVILPCPFGRPIETVGSDSAGTVIDVMLSRLATPMLVIRRADMTLAQCTRRVAVVVGGECDVESQAASWAFGMAEPGSTVTLNLVIEKEQFENMRTLIEAIDPDVSVDLDSFGKALTKTHRGLHSAMAKTAGTLSMTYHLRPQAGEVAPPNLMLDTTAMMMVMPIEVDDRFTQGFVQDRIRRSPHPILVIPGHVAS